MLYFSRELDWNWINIESNEGQTFILFIEFIFFSHSFIIVSIMIHFSRWKHVEHSNSKCSFIAMYTREKKNSLLHETQQCMFVCLTSILSWNEVNCMTIKHTIILSFIHFKIHSVVNERFLNTPRYFDNLSICRLNVSHSIYVYIYV